MLDYDELPEDYLLTTKDLAEWLRICEKSIENMRRDDPKSLPTHIRVGRSIRYRVATVRSFFRRMEKEARAAIDEKLAS